MSSGGADSAEYEALLRDVLTTGLHEADDVRLVLFYILHVELTETGELLPRAQEEEHNAIFKQVAGELGITYIDMFADFNRNYQEEHTLPYGFLNSPIGTGHLNSVGHRLIADALAEIL